tara:strand:+ start:93 stop:506 length:414 start_codon:yes stop_codon:yes gene_type:complete
MQELPHEIRMKMLYYAHPIMNETLQRAIKVTAAHQLIKRLNTQWMVVVPPPIQWCDFIENNLSKEERKELFNTLANCGCCHRHSHGVYHNRCHCSNVVGSHTTKQYHKKTTWSYKKCSCWCRMQMRQLALLDSKLIE